MEVLNWRNENKVENEESLRTGKNTKERHGLFKVQVTQLN